MKLGIITIAAIAIVGVSGYVLSRGNRSNTTPTQIQNNVSVVDGKQVVAIVAKGGYTPRNSNAKANMPTVLKVITNSTFDCSSSIVISDIGYRKYLPSSGETLIDIPPQQPGTVMQGTCSMGMYRFAIHFN